VYFLSKKKPIGTPFHASDEKTTLNFQSYLVQRGLQVTLRESRGEEAMMACGQLGDTTAQAMRDRRKPPVLKVPEKYREALDMER